MTTTTGNSKKINNAKDLLTDEQRDVLRTKENKIEKLEADIQNLSKPLLQPESTWSNHVTPTTLSIFDDGKSWSGIEGIESRKANFNNAKQFQEASGQSWNVVKDIMCMESEDDSHYSEDSPTITRLDAKDMNVFGTMPLKEDIVVIKCKQCSRPLLASQFKDHLETCRSSNANTDEDTNLTKKTKRALEEEVGLTVDSPEKKKQKKEKQKKTSKQKAPIDLDKQCGVIQAPSTTPCTRSITCKNHSMGAKRAVEGRSQPYDVLLAAYQKKSIGRPNAKEQAAAKLKENGLLGADGSSVDAAGKAIKSNYNEHIFNMNNVKTTLNHEDTPFIDSDEEVESVMQSIKQSRPSPLAQKPYFYTKRRRQCFRLKDILLDAITPKSSVISANNNNNTITQQPALYSQQQYPIETSFISLNNTSHFW